MNNYITAYYNDEEDLLKGINIFREKKLEIMDVLTPFPVHGLDKALGIPRSRLARIAFAGGAVGGIIGFVFQTWVFTNAYPINFGGKPYFAVPSFIPVAFELTILFAAFSMVIAYFIGARLGPGANNVIHDERITDDRFVIVIRADKPESTVEIQDILREAGAQGITYKP